MSVRGAHGCAFHIAEYLTLRQVVLLEFYGDFPYEHWTRIRTNTIKRVQDLMQEHDMNLCVLTKNAGYRTPQSKVLPVEEGS